MAGRWLVLHWTLVAVAILTFPAAAQGGASLPQGPIYLTDTLVVEAGERLRVGPNTSVTGPGRIEVWGDLEVVGEADGLAELSVPVLLLGNGSSSFEYARFWGLGATALEVRGGEARFRNAVFEGNSRAVLVGGSSRLVSVDSAFRDHGGEALYVEGGARVELEGGTFSGNARGITLYSAARFSVNGTNFERNGEHLVVDLGPWSAPGEIVVERSRFGALTSAPAPLPALRLRHEAPLVDEAVGRVVRLDSNRIENASIGVRAEGRGLTVLSSNDTIVDNRVGISVHLATVQVSGGWFGNDRDVDGTGRVTLDSITYLREGAHPVFREGAAPRVFWPLVASIGLLGGVAVVVPLMLRAKRARRAPSPPVVAPPPAPADDAVPPPPATLAVDLRTPITEIERRILEDIDRNPGTAQRAIADRLGTTRQALHYHVKKLEARGLILKVVDGRETRCSLPPAVAAMLKTERSTRTESQEKG